MCSHECDEPLSAAAERTAISALMLAFALSTRESVTQVMPRRAAKSVTELPVSLNTPPRKTSPRWRIVHAHEFPADQNNLKADDTRIDDLPPQHQLHHFPIQPAQHTHHRAEVWRVCTGGWRREPIGVGGKAVYR